MNRKEFLRGLLAAGGALSAATRAQSVATDGHQATSAVAATAAKHPRAIAMWDFSWLERRWPGAGYEDWDRALDELVERGYDAVRIDPYPHLVAADPGKLWQLQPVWETQDWGAPTIVRVRVVPELHQFIRKCADRKLKVGLSTWFRQDEADVRSRISTPEKLADIWKATLTGIQRAGLLDTVLYVDLCNEWPIEPWQTFVKPPLTMDEWAGSRSMLWMRSAIASLRAAFPQLPLLFSTNIDRVETFSELDISFFDALEHHLWMTGENDDEFYRLTGYQYERFSQVGYHNLQLKAADAYAQRSAHWQKLLMDKIARLANSARRASLPLMTTECWAIVDYKDWPLLPWDWVKELCALGTRTASATGQWVAIGTSNFCGPQFHGMWRDIAWHRQLTQVIKSGPLDATVQKGRLWERL